MKPKSIKRYKDILAIGLPLIGAMVSQNILNLIDTAMVGRLGNAALAGVGLGGFAFFMATAFLQGLSSGVQAISSRKIGEGKPDEGIKSLNSGIALAAIIGIPLTIFLVIFTPDLFPLLSDDPKVIAEGVDYLQARMVGVFAIAIAYCFRGYWSAVKKTRYYFYTIVFSHVVNLILNYLLIFGKFGFPKMGAEGAGVASSIALLSMMAIYFATALVKLPSYLFLKFGDFKAYIKQITEVSLPTGLQLFFFATGLTLQYKIIGMIGTLELAASNVIVNISLVAILPALGLGMAAATLVGQALGRGDDNDAENWGWDTVKLGMFIIFLIGLPMIFFPSGIMSFFTQETDTIQISVLPLRLLGSMLWFDAIGMVLIQSHFGAGDTKRTSIVSVFIQWGYFLPLIYIGVRYFNFLMLDVWIAQISYRCLQSVVYVYLWKKGDWKKIKI